MNPIKQKAPGSNPEPSKTRATASAVPRPNEQLNSGTVLEGAYDTRPEPLKNKANTYQMLSSDGKHTLEVFTARENDGGDYQLKSNELRRRLAEYNRANPKQSGEALSALAVWEYLHEKSGKSGTTYELTQADICFDLGLVTKSGSAKVKRLGELVAVLVEIGALFTDRAMYRTVSGEMAKGGYHYTPSLIVLTKGESVEAGLPEPISQSSTGSKKVRVLSRSGAVNTVSTSEVPLTLESDTSPSLEREVPLSGAPPFIRSTRYELDSLDSQGRKKEKLISEPQIRALEAIWAKHDTLAAVAIAELLEREGIEHLNGLSMNRASEIIKELNALPVKTVYERYLEKHRDDDDWPESVDTANSEPTTQSTEAEIQLEAETNTGTMSLGLSVLSTPNRPTSSSTATATRTRYSKAKGKPASDSQLELVKQRLSAERQRAALIHYGLEQLSQLSSSQANELIMASNKLKPELLNLLDLTLSERKAKAQSEVRAREQAAMDKSEADDARAIKAGQVSLYGRELSEAEWAGRISLIRAALRDKTEPAVRARGRKLKEVEALFVITPEARLAHLLELITAA